MNRFSLSLVGALFFVSQGTQPVHTSQPPAEPKKNPGKANLAPFPEIEIVFPAKVVNQPVSGRLLLVAGPGARKDGPPAFSWWQPPSLFAMEVKDWKPGVPLRYRPTFAFPGSLELPPGKRSFQAVLDRDLGGRSPISSPGNLYGPAVEASLVSKDPVLVRLVLDRVNQEPVFREKERVKLVDIPSPLLTKFHGRPMRLRAGVLLPRSHGKDPNRKYPVIYEIPGFGGDHHHVERAEKRQATDVAGVEMIHVTLDPGCRLGHHVFADSANNGPCGRALVEELIPHIEKSFGGLGTPRGRFVTGHSSGGWSSLWLQVTYPDFFGGVWSTAPDPVDFRDFQKVDIYRPGTSLFFDEKGTQRPIARKGGKALLFYKPFSDVEVVLGRGTQLFSFEAVFSPRGKDGNPRPLWNRETGRVDAETAAAWRRYDIRAILEKNWETLGPKLAGKVHVYMGAEDNYYLDGATRLLGETLKKLGSDAVVEIFPGRDHGNLLTSELRSRIAREMAAAFRAGGP